MAVKVGMVSLGCPKNQVDAEIMLSILQKNGYEITADENQADAIIVNTCGFIGDAKQEAIDNIIELGELKKQNKLKAIIVTDDRNGLTTIQTAITGSTVAYAFSHKIQFFRQGSDIGNAGG